jgi:hypothetical protein
MPRSFGRVLSSIWDDEDFRSVSLEARAVYIFLFSQKDLNHAGVIGIRMRRWGRMLALSPQTVSDLLDELAKAQYVVIDDETEELLVRSLIRRDDIWRQPNVFKAAAADARAVQSSGIKGVLLAEIRRLDLSSASRETQLIRDELATHLEPFGNPSPTPPDAQPAPRDADTPDTPEGPGLTEPDDTGQRPGQNPSGTLPKPSGNHSAGGTGEGEGNGPVLVVSPSPKTSPPPPPKSARAASAQRPLIPFGLPGAQTEEGENQMPSETPDIPALIASLRQIRRDWTGPAIEQALAKPGCAERPWDLVWEAAHILAADDKTDQPGRLPCDGPWWAEARRRLRGQRAVQGRPDWCEECDERTRMIGDDHPQRCPRCHPLAARAS